jgi:putative transposase
MSLSVPERPTDNYAPFFQPGTVFITCWAVNGEGIFAQRPAAHLVRSVLHKVKAKRPFTMLGFVILPDHLHLLIRPEPETTVESVVAALSEQYQRQYARLRGIPGTLEVWDRHRSFDRVADVARFAQKLDMIHYDPVQHGLVTRPEDWRDSSYGAWVERGLYKLGWGWQKPARLGGG